MNKCPHCGEPTEQGAAFCGNCGQPLAIGQTASASFVNNPQPLAGQQSPIAQVLENQQSNPVPLPGNMAPALAGVPNMPAYAKEYADPGARKGEIEATIGLLCGVVAIPAALFIPILALGLGGTGIVLGTIGRSKYKHTLSLMAVILPVIGILAGFAVFGIAASSSSATRLAQGNVGSSSTNMVMVDTPCYDVKIDGGLKHYTPSNCNFDAASSNEEFAVNAIYNPKRAR